MAYVLGFFIADGTVAHGSQFISFSQKEKYILENIKKEIGSDHPFYQNKKTGVYTLALNSKIMKEDIIKIHGIMPNKSSSVKFPYIPDEYISHFIRGYFDGDGYINYEKYTVTFVGGSKDFMESLIEILTIKDLKTQFVTENNHYRVHIRGRKSIKLFSNWIYSNADKDLYLTRKYNSFKKENLTLEYLSDRKDTLTRDAVANRKLNFLMVYSVLKSEKETCYCLNIQVATLKRWLKVDELFSYNFTRLSILNIEEE